ncbi:MAG: carboxylating nicotinate-nucleotide diphosphorylase [Candidatus Brockarchaeota archaeon]|nr:carboxylating nicotinate-nucleotide diphosphorylase [Candidatus Brockarchaeota archaeon]
MRSKIEAEKFFDYVGEDLPFFDVTSELIEEEVKCRAAIIAKQNFVLAGLEECMQFLKLVGINVKQLKKDGDDVKEGEKIAILEGNARDILGIERLILNIIAHASGVATATNNLVKLCRKINPKIRIAATRKTLPGLRYLEKKAVKLGGGDTHRMSLSDMILIKDNHIRIIGGVREAIKRAKEKASSFVKVEIEVSSLDEAIEAVKEGADIIMLDNFTIEEIKETVNKLKELKLREKVLIEVSGRINEENILDYANCDVDVISSGAITHSAKAVDVSLEVFEVLRL